jgi:alkylhydroperoxidase family enzyme
MTRLPFVNTEQPSPELGAVIDGLRQVAGADFKVPNLYRIIGHSPQMLKGWIDFAWPLRLNATTERSLRELLILRGAQICEARYEWAHHVPMAFDAGVSREQVAALHRWREVGCFDARQRAALQVAEEVSQGPGASAEAIDALKLAGFSEAQVVELVLTASFYVCVARFLASMAMPLEAGYERYLDGGQCRLPAGI